MAVGVSAVFCAGGYVVAENIYQINLEEGGIGVFAITTIGILSKWVKNKLSAQRAQHNNFLEQEYTE